MISEKIREKIVANEQWKPTLIGFESCIGEVEFFKNANGYFIMAKGAGGSWDDLFTILPAKTIEGLVLFMQGALLMWNGTIKRKYKEE